MTRSTKQQLSRCPYCRKTYVVRADGYLWRHDRPNAPNSLCPAVRVKRGKT